MNANDRWGLSLGELIAFALIRSGGDAQLALEKLEAMRATPAVTARPSFEHNLLLAVEAIGLAAARSDSI